MLIYISIYNLMNVQCNNIIYKCCRFSEKYFYVV